MLSKHDQYPSHLRLCAQHHAHFCANNWTLRSLHLHSDQAQGPLQVIRVIVTAETECDWWWRDRS